MSTHQALVQTQPGTELRTFMGSLKILANVNLGVSQFTKFRVASCHCSASCYCSHALFIVRSVKLVHSSQVQLSVSLSFSHPSRCSRSTLAIVCFCALYSVSTSGLCLYRVSVFMSGLQLHHQSHHRLRQPPSCGGVWDPRSVE